MMATSFDTLYQIWVATDRHSAMEVSGFPRAKAVMMNAKIMRQLNSPA